MDKLSEFSINPILVLDDTERAALGGIFAHDGFRVVRKIFRSCVDQFAVSLLKTETSEADEILARHRDARIAAGLYELLLDKINEEVSIINSQIRENEPIDVAESLDIGDYVDFNEDYEEEESF